MTAQDDHHTHADKIYILQVVPGGAASENGTIQVDDILVSVDGRRVEVSGPSW